MFLYSIMIITLAISAVDLMCLMQQVHKNTKKEEIKYMIRGIICLIISISISFIVF